MKIAPIIKHRGHDRIPMLVPARRDKVMDVSNRMSENTVLCTEMHGIRMERDMLQHQVDLYQRSMMGGPPGFSPHQSALLDQPSPILAIRQGGVGPPPPPTRRGEPPGSLLRSMETVGSRSVGLNVSNGSFALNSSLQDGPAGTGVRRLSTSPVLLASSPKPSAMETDGQADGEREDNLETSQEGFVSAKEGDP